MNYGWNLNYLKNAVSFGSLSREFYYANMLIDEVLAENLKEVKWLLEVKQANPNTVVPDRGVAALHLLAGLENEDFSEEVILLVLCHHGGDANVRCEDGLTPVHVAAMWGRCRVLGILLENGGNPDLKDYQMLLDAEEYALRELQWQAYAVLGAYLRDVECDENSSQHEGVRNKSLESMRESKFTTGVTSLVVSRRRGDIVSEDCDLLLKPIGLTALNENAIGAIRNHRSKTEIYEDYTTVTTEDSRPPSNIQPSRKRQEKLVESETYICSFAESSTKVQSSTPRSSVSIKSSESRKSFVDCLKNPNNQILCKMSRIFLFMLKRKHVYERLK